ncbi:MAG: hypothetical protein ACOH5I_21680 [Oligoflexus sp.]
MKTIFFNQVRNFRKERNNDLIRRMQNGDQLTSFNSYSSWYPPRPIIQKDPKAVRELYGSAPHGGNHDHDKCEQEKANQHTLRLA